MAADNGITKGYKQTEVGVIPVDWKVKNLGSAATFQRGFDLPLAKIKEGKYPVVTSSGISGFHNAFKAKGPGIVTGRYGTLGEMFYVKENYFPHNTTLYIKDFNGNYPRFIFYLLSRVAIEFGQFKDKTGVPGLNRNDLHSIKVTLPPTLAEQTAIATALSDTDALLTALDRLIAKKRQLKQGAMQRLLSGKERLAGFEGEWVVKRLGEIFEISAGGDLNKDEFSPVESKKYCYPIYANSLTNKGIYGFSSYAVHLKDAITVTARGTLGFAFPRHQDFTAIGRLLVLRPVDAINIVFVSELINTFIEFASESTGVPQLTAPQISKYTVRLPLLAEQTAIATILSDMDAEIAALEGKRAKLGAVKVGMMQELLTGKIRLI